LAWQFNQLFKKRNFYKYLSSKENTNHPLNLVAFGEILQRTQNHDAVQKDKPMFDTPLHVSDAAFEQTVLNSNTPVIVDFWAPWCGPCKMIAPILDKLAKEYAGKVLVAKVNTDDNPEWAQKYGVQGIPTMLFISGGKIVHRQVGALPERMLKEAVAQFLEVAGQN
jgi:thioredoxin 1